MKAQAGNLLDISQGWHGASPPFLRFQPLRLLSPAEKACIFSSFKAIGRPKNNPSNPKGKYRTCPSYKTSDGEQSHR